MRKSIILLIFTAVILGGCAQIEYKDVKYTRVGNQELTGLYIWTDELTGQIHVELGRQGADNTEIFVAGFKAGIAAMKAGLLIP